MDNLFPASLYPGTGKCELSTWRFGESRNNSILKTSVFPHIHSHSPHSLCLVSTLQCVLNLSSLATKEAWLVEWMNECWTPAHFSNNVNEQLQGGGIVNQGVGVKRTEVFPWTDIVVSCAKVRADFVAVFNSANSEWERATWIHVNTDTKRQISTHRSLFHLKGRTWRKNTLKIWLPSVCYILLWYY